MSGVMARPVGSGGYGRHAVRIEAATEGVSVSGEPTVRDELLPTGAKAPLLYFPDGRRYAVEDTLALDTVLAEARMKQRRRRFAWRGMGWQCLVLLLLLLAAMATVAQRWTLPLAIDALVGGMSSHMLRAASEQALERVDAEWLASSELDDARQNALRARFATLHIPGGEPVAWRVLFRSGARTGPLVFSLPNGDIVLTDELVHQARSDDEVVAVLAHEFGHLQRDDALRTLAARRPWLVLRSWLASDSQVPILAQALLDTAPTAGDAATAERDSVAVLAANKLAPSAMSLLRDMPGMPRPAGLPPLLAGR